MDTLTDRTFDRCYPGVEAHLPSLAYLAVKGTPLEEKPFRSFTWRVDVWLDQGQEGRCVEFGLCHELAATPVRVPESVVRDLVARKAIYWPAQEQDQWPGGSYPGATPHYEGTSVLAGTKVAAELGFYDEYRWGLDAKDLARMVGYRGPSVIGVDFYEGMAHPDADGYMRVAGAKTGGHCMLVYGVIVRSGSPVAFKIWNSWGRGWGKDGTALISYGDMEKLIADQGEVMLPVRRKI